MKQIDIKMVLGALACAGIGIGLISGAIQDVIYFADPMNEMLSCALMFMGTIGFAANIKR
jgi:hypothetical protein